MASWLKLKRSPKLIILKPRGVQQEAQRSLQQHAANTDLLARVAKRSVEMLSS